MQAYIFLLVANSWILAGQYKAAKAVQELLEEHNKESKLMT